MSCQLIFDVRDAGPGILVLPGLFGLLLVVIGIPIHLAMRKKWPYKSWGTLLAGIIFLAVGGAIIHARSELSREAGLAGGVAQEDAGQQNSENSGERQASHRFIGLC